MSIANLTAFGEMATAQFEPLCGWAFTYNINPALYKTEIVSTGSVTHSSNCALCSTGTGSDGSGKIETISSSRYVPVVGGTWAYVSEEVGPVEVNKTLTGYTGAQQIGSWGLGKSDGRTIDLELSKFRVYTGALIVIEAIPDGASDTIVSVGWKQFL